MLISVLISTHNRAERLPPLFDAFSALDIPRNLVWEFLMVDNGSNDETLEILLQEKARKRLPLVLLEQPIPGKSSAMNLALGRVRGDLVVFTDDDVKPAGEWLKAYYEAASANPNALGFAGKVLPVWEGKVPSWLQTEGDFALPRGLINSFDFGEESHVLPENVIPSGSNSALRGTVMRKMGTFRTDLGPGTPTPFAEDTEYMGRLLKTGGRYLYVPDALLYHLNSPERMTRAHIQKWMFETARSRVKAFGAETTVPTFFRIPRYLIRQILERFLFWIFDPRSQNRFHNKLGCLRTLGAVRGYLDLGKVIDSN